MRGAKLFARIWFTAMFIFLIALNAGFWVVGPELIEGWRRILFGCLIGTLIVAGASLLTRMLLQYWAAIERLEAGGKTA